MTAHPRRELAVCPLGARRRAACVAVPSSASDETWPPHSQGGRQKAKVSGPRPFLTAVHALEGGSRAQWPRCPKESPLLPPRLHVGRWELVLWEATLSPGGAGMAERVPGASVLFCSQFCPVIGLVFPRRPPVRASDQQGGPAGSSCSMAAALIRAVHPSPGSGLLL